VLCWCVRTGAGVRGNPGVYVRVRLCASECAFVCLCVHVYVCVRARARARACLLIKGVHDASQGRVRGVKQGPSTP
jgi:hypothetical protein